MLFAERIRRCFPLTPTAQQEEAFIALGNFFSAFGPSRCFVMRGYAGTGKTTLVGTVVRLLPSLSLRSVLLAPTGRAAKVMSRYAGKSAFTIHKKIYRKKVALAMDSTFGLAPNPHKNTLFIVDEASMIANERTFFGSKGLLDDLMEYVRSGDNCAVMFVGDTAQLPPVGMLQSPALDGKYLEAAYGLTVFAIEMTDVVRQEQQSGVLANATRVRQLIQAEKADSDPPGFPQLRTAGYRDVFRMTGQRLIDGLNYAYDTYGMDNTLVICRSNKNANLYNQHIRNTILYREEELTGGDHVMVVRNNYYWLAQETERDGFIANGDTALVRRVRNVHEQHGFRFADVTLEFADMEELEPLSCRVILESLHSESAQLSDDDQQRLYESVMEDYAHLPNKDERLAALKADPYFNALQIKFAMAVTCHKAQGGQWDVVFVDQGYLNDDMLNTEFLRWLYTAITRAVKELYFVNFSDSFFRP